MPFQAMCAGWDRRWRRRNSNERPNEPFLFFAADKTDPGAFNLPLYLAFADPMNTPGLILAPNMAQGFRFVIMDVNHTEGDRIIELIPEKLYEIAALLRDTDQYVVESIWSVASGEQAVVASTSRLHNVREVHRQGRSGDAGAGPEDFPATGEVLAPYAIGAYMAGGMRGSHQMPLMPVPLQSGISYFDGPPVITCAAFCHARRTVYRTSGRVRPSVLEPITGYRLPQSHRHATPRVLWCGHAAHGGIGVYRHHGKYEGA